MEWAMRKVYQKKWFRAAMSLYQGTKTKVRLETKIQVKFPVKAGEHQGCFFRSFLGHRPKRFWNDRKN